MNIIENVKLKSDTNYIPVRYSVMSVTVGSTLDASYVWLKCAAHGIDTEGHFTTLKTQSEASDGVDLSNLTGTLNAYSVVSLNDIESYASPGSYSFGDIRVGWGNY